MMLVYFLSGGCVDDIVNNQTNHQFTSVILEHFMNSARVCWITKRTVFNVYSCSNHIKRSCLKIKTIFLFRCFL